MASMNRRTFLGGLAATGFTIVPRRVLGGQGFTPPSDMCPLAQVGCGTQAQRQMAKHRHGRPGKLRTTKQNRLTRRQAKTQSKRISEPRALASGDSGRMDGTT